MDKSKKNDRPYHQDDDEVFPSEIFPEEVFPKDVFPTDIFPRKEQKPPPPKKYGCICSVKHDES